MKYHNATIAIVICCCLGMALCATRMDAATIVPKPVVVRSIDTMKYSRDVAREKMNDPAFDEEIQEEVSLIKDTGATHIAIGVPYDEEFIPMLQRWVDAARAQGLSVWFRGNFSGWEGWFGYKKIDRAEHLRMLESFLSKHGELFKNGDVFTPCPECENGGPGDPRKTGDSSGYNDFLIQEYTAAHAAFQRKGIAIAIYPSMNFDVAWQIITPETAASIGGTILIDHYVSSAQKFSDDIARLGKKVNASVGIGEFGAPIPDLNGAMSEKQQAAYVQSLTDGLIQQNIAVVNYWTLKGGSTELVNGDGKKRAVYDVIQTYFHRPYVYGIVRDDLLRPIPHAEITVGDNVKATADAQGIYHVVLNAKPTTITVEKDGYTPTVAMISGPSLSVEKDVYVTPMHTSLLYKIKLFFLHLFRSTP